MKRFLVTGANGQIGSYLVDLLLSNNMEVVGIAKRPMTAPGLIQANGGLDSEASVEALLDNNGPLDGMAHLAGLSSVSYSWNNPLEVMEINTISTIRIVEAARKRNIPLVFASSAEIFGSTSMNIQNEDTPISPISPYGVSKAAAHNYVRMTRDSYNSKMTNLIFYVGESERRPGFFVFRKITKTIASILRGEETKLCLGSINVIRDFCHASDFASAVYMFLNGEQPGDYIVSSGEGHTIMNVLEKCCALANIDIGAILVKDNNLVRMSDIKSLVGDCSRIKKLGWKPTMNFDNLVKHIFEHDLNGGI